MDIAIIIMALIIGFVVLCSIVIVPVVLKSLKESKEEKEYQEKKKSE